VRALEQPHAGPEPWLVQESPQELPLRSREQKKWEPWLEWPPGPLEVQRALPGNSLHSPELPASSSCTLPPQGESSERTLLPDVGV